MKTEIRQQFQVKSKIYVQKEELPELIKQLVELGAESFELQICPRYPVALDDNGGEG